MNQIQQPEGMQLLFEKAGKQIRKSEDITIYTHTDCDGITSAGIITSILDRLDKQYEVNYTEINELEDQRNDSDLTIITDLGAGQDVTGITKKPVIVLDHHPPVRKLESQQNTGRIEINPNYYNLDGSYTVSGGGLSYFLAKTFGYRDLSWMGILSAIGDMQNSMTGKLRGLNREILADAREAGVVEAQDDLVLYGRHTRPLFVALSYFGDVHLPLTNNRNECIYFLESLSIPVKDDFGNIRYMCDLSFEEKSRLFNQLLKMMSREVPARYVKHVPKLILGESYEFTHEEKYTTYKDASEYSTVVNACGRNREYDLATRAIKDGRSGISSKLGRIVKDHKRYLAQSLSEVSENNNVEILENIQYFDAGSIRANVVGTIAGMILNSYDWQKPMIGYTYLDESDTYKVSLRCSKLLAYDGIHFGKIVSEISQKCGGSGGGHSVACGAYIPGENIDEFIMKLNNSIQLR